MMVLLLRSVRFPLKWKKFRGGFKFDWVGYHIDLIRKEAGINDGRSLWVSRWCGGTVDQGTILVRNFLEALGRISFAAQVLWFVKPFLGPLFAWVSNMPRGALVTLPPMIRMILTWLQRQFDAIAGALWREDCPARRDLQG